MKKQILSLLLLFVMLVTMIPVAAVAAEEEAPAGEQDYDYYDLYVQDGLKVLLTAIDADEDDGIVLSNGIGTWKNRVNDTAINALRAYGNDLTTGQWRVGTNGGIGFPVYAGQVNADDSYSKYSVYNTLAHGEYTENGTTHAQNRKAMALMLDAANLPTGSFTVEYLAQYNHLEAVYGYTDEAKGIVEGASAGDVINYKSSDEINHAWGGHTGVAMTDQFGHLSAWTTHVDGYYEGIESHGRGSVVWMLKENMTRGQFAANATKLAGGNGLMKEGEAFHQYDAIHTYTVSLLKEDYTGANETAYLRGTYTLLRDRVTYQSAVANTENPDATDGTAFPSANHRTDNPALFCLSYSVPTDFYGVRVYNRVLSAEEQAQNHVVDVLEYYNLSVDKVQATTKMAELSEMFASVGFEQDATVKAAKTLEMQTVLDERYPHEHNFVEGQCACGESDPNYVPHEHSFVEGQCACGETDPNYVPHEHSFVEGKCECGETDPNYTPATENPEGSNEGLGTGAIVGIIIGSVAVVGIGFALWWFVFRKKKLV